MIMKELSTEEKAKAYDEALEKARKELQTCKSLDCDAARQIFRFFPVLKESEDERIRKAIIDFLMEPGRKEYILNGFTVDDVIAWLEKQGKQKPFDYEKVNIQQKDFAPKVEPKFKVGDWIVTKDGKVNQVKTVTDGGDAYTLDDETYFSGSWKDIYRLWTIQDAKDGDALVHNGHTFIFMGIKDGLVQAIEDIMHALVPFGEPDKDNDYYPATKEQRELLLQKMHEAGYEWDVDKKELKKIEQKPAWSEEDEVAISDICKKLEMRAADEKRVAQRDNWERTYYLIDWLKSLKPKNL